MGRLPRSGYRHQAAYPSPSLIEGEGYRSRSLIALAERAASGAMPWLLDVTRKPDATTAEQEIRSWHGFGRYATRHLLVLNRSRIHAHIRLMRGEQRQGLLLFE